MRNRHLKGLSVYEADSPEAHIDLAQDVRDPGVGIAATDIDDPLPKHRRIDERLAPEHVATRGCARRKVRNASCGMNATLLATTVARL